MFKSLARTFDMKTILVNNSTKIIQKKTETL